MGFKSIGDLAISVLAKLDIEEPGTAGSNALNPQSGPRSERGEGTPAPRSENGLPVYIAPRTGKEGEKPGLRNQGRTVNGKMADAETPARVVQEVSQTQDKSRGGTAMSYRKPMLTVLPVSKRMKVARPTGVAPRQAAFIHLITVDGMRVHHVASQPMA